MKCSNILQEHMLHYVHSNLIYNSQKLERTQISLNRGMIQKMWYIYTMEYYSAIKNSEFIKFLGKWMYVSGGYHPEWGNPITKEGTWYALTNKWILAQKPRIPKIQLPKHKKIKKEDQCVDTSFLPRIGNKIPMEGVAKTKIGAKTKGWTIQRLPQPGVHLIISYQMQTLLHMPARLCWKDPDIAVSCETMPVPGKYRSGAHSHL